MCGRIWTPPDCNRLTGFGDEVNQHLRQAAAVAAARWQFGGHLHLERELLVGRQRLQRAADGLGNVLNGIIGQFEHKLTGLDLGQVEHVIDEAERGESTAGSIPCRKRF